MSRVPQDADDRTRSDELRQLISEAAARWRPPRKVEQAGVADLFARPRHPYTRGLMTSIPRLNRAPDETAHKHRLTEIRQEDLDAGHSRS
jgi:ABC-type oligopeptide transport system ATPase subunit